MAEARPSTPTAREMISTAMELKKLEEKEKQIMEEKLYKADYRENITYGEETEEEREKELGAIKKIMTIKNEEREFIGVPPTEKGEQSKNSNSDFSMAELIKNHQELMKNMDYLKDKQAQLEAEDIFTRQQQNERKIIELTEMGRRGGDFGNNTNKPEELRDLKERIEELERGRKEKINNKTKAHLLNDVGTHTDSILGKLKLCKDIENDRHTTQSKTIKEFNQYYNQKYNLGDNWDNFITLFINHALGFPKMTEKEFVSSLIRALGPKAINVIPTEVFFYDFKQFTYYLCSVFSKTTSRMTKLDEFAAYRGTNAYDIKEMVKELSDLGMKAEVDIDSFMSKFINIIPSRVEEYFSPLLMDLLKENNGTYPEDFKPLMFIIQKLDQHPVYNMKLGKPLDNKKVAYTIRHVPTTVNNGTVVKDRDFKRRPCRFCDTPTRHNPWFSCPDRKYCLLCSSNKHNAPECTIYYREQTLPNECSICFNTMGKKLFHSEKVCRNKVVKN